MGLAGGVTGAGVATVNVEVIVAAETLGHKVQANIGRTKTTRKLGLRENHLMMGRI
ncbi:MAG: hypothetical protein U0401_13550 [Anaerolineae bacterium]